ncbi:MAG: alpha-1,2-fucosyltransferase, partial [Verrucomicrobiota bacterium]|nr:alpha-1,2-fucosyltransferase [Verrucomicrobiota bacterium]
LSLALPRSGALATNYNDANSALKSGMSVRLRGLFQDADRLHSKRDQVIGAVREGLARLSSKNDIILPHKFSAIHVRRGDYISVKKYLSEFGVCSVDYYRKAIERLNPELPILVVTDDHDWVRSTLMKIDDRIQLYEGKNHFDDLFTLSLAHELVMANSTFSWWAAYQSSAELVISPNPWFTNSKREQDLVHPSWIKIPRD